MSNSTKLARKYIRKFFTYLFATGSAIATGALCFAGMLAIYPVLWFSGLAFFLSLSIEGEVNRKSINEGLKRIFTPRYLATQIMRRYKAVQDDKPVESIKDDDVTFMLIQLHQGRRNDQDKLFSSDEDFKRLSREITRKLWLIRLSFILSIGGGISSGFVALSAMQGAVITLSFLSVIPAWGLLALAIFAAIGYSLVLYQSISKVIQDYDGKFSYFAKRQNENYLNYGFRCFGMVVAVGLAIFVTVATAGTWWTEAKAGILWLERCAEGTAAILRTCTVVMMLIPNLIFGVSNSVESVDKLATNNYRAFFNKLRISIVAAWGKENVLQFFNPFRLIALIVQYTAGAILFLLHIFCHGLIGDRPGFLPPLLCAIFGATTDALVDINYIFEGDAKHSAEKPQHKHNHQSWFVFLFMLPVNIVVNAVNFFGFLWDVTFGFSMTAHYEHKKPVESEPVEWDVLLTTPFAQQYNDQENSLAVQYGKDSCIKSSWYKFFGKAESASSEDTTPNLSK